MNVLVVLAHPNDDSFNHAIAAAAMKSLSGAGHDAQLLDLYALGVKAAMSAEERTAYHGEHPVLDQTITGHIEFVRAAEALVFIYPTWWSSLPAILKGWLERVMVPGVGFVFDEAGKVRPGLTHIRRIVGISTYGSPRRYVRAMNDNGRRTLTRALRMSCGLRTRCRWLGLYKTDTASAAALAAFLVKVDHRMRSL